MAEKELQKTSEETTKTPSDDAGSLEDINERRPLKLDLAEFYKFDPEDLSADITSVCYSNLSYIQVAQRDVFIDFLQMPGVKRDGKMVISGTRVYLSHAAAQRLSESLNTLLKEVHRSGRMEKFKLTSDPIETTTKISRPAKEDQA